MEQPTASYSSPLIPRPPPSARAAPRSINQPHRGSILVVEDDPHIAEILAHTLASEGYLVRSAPDGAAALDAVVEDPPDLVVSDIMMPKLDGITLARRLREWGIAVPVVLISAAYQDVDLPGVRFLPKPFDLDHLIDIVGHAIGKDG